MKQDNIINYDNENLEDLTRYIEEGKPENDNGRVWKLIENPGVPCEVKVTEKSVKILSKILLK